MDNFIDPSKVEEFKLLQLEGKRLASIGDLKASLQKFELAKRICPTPKVLQRIEKIKAHLRIPDSSEKYQPLPHLSSTTSTSEYNVENPLTLKSIDRSTIDLQTSIRIKDESKILSDIKNIQGDQKHNEKRSSSSDLSPPSRLKFKQLKNEAKAFAYAGKYTEAVNCFKRALSICDCPNVLKYIKEIESLPSASDDPAKELEDQFTEKYQHSTDLVQKSIKTNIDLIQPSDTKELTGHLKIEKEVRKHSSEQKSPLMQSSGTRESTENAKDEERKCSSEQKSPASDSVNDSDIERKLAEVKIIYEEARDLAASGKLSEALKLLKEAQSIHETQKVQKRIDKLQELIAANLDNPEEDKYVEITKGFSVYHGIYDKLYPYQREGVAWMWKLHKMGKGGILGDDMGLGKTFQVIAFISGMVDADLIKHVLIIMPVSLLKNWEKEFKKWCPGIAVHDFHSGTKKERERNKLKVQRRGHVLLTSYGMVVNNVNILTEMDGSEFVWDYVILDEGHKIKNPTKTTKAVYDIPAKNRLVLTGTPIQNNLRELWSLYDFVHQGTLLGSLKTFKLQYENPITRSREKDATAGEKRLGSEMAENLKALIKPYFLRRTKDEVWRNEADKDIENLETQMENMKISQLNARKNDLILWTYMSDPQIAIYQDFLHSDAVKSILVSKRSPLVELTTLKKICDHPRLLSQRACFHLGLNGELQHGDVLDLDDESTLASSIDNVTDETLLKESGKLKLVIDLLEHLKETGHRTLVFSLSRKILDMIHRILVNKNWKVMRLDGTITKTVDREKRIMKFQRDTSYPVFLLTTQVGGVGITLTAADRVIIYDPSWNPATDAQAVDRAYRIGQEKDVVVYRLITCGTVEEKIYRRQIFKDSITRQATGVADPYRYFSKQELRELFTLDDPRYSATQVQLHEMHSSQRSTYDELEKHLEFLRRLNIFGISDHDLMFSKQVEDNTEDNDPNAISEHFIQQKVAAAHAQIQMEANVVAEGIRLAGTFNRPYQEVIPIPKKNTTKDPYKPPTLPDIVDLTEDAQDHVFPSNTTKRNSSPTKKFSDDDDIEIVSPKSKNGSILDQEKPVFSVGRTSENVFSQSNKLSPALSSLKNFSRLHDIGDYSNSENAVDYSAAKLDKNPEVSLIKTEKLRKSSVNKPLLQDEIENENILENPDEDMNLDETQIKNANKQIIEDDIGQPAPSDIKPVDIPSDLKEKFQANLTHYMNDDIADLSFDEEAPIVTVKKGRKSCARHSMVISESDSSCPNSASNSVNFVDESDGTESDSEDSSSSASIPFVPESASNTPQISHIKSHENIHHSISKTPPIYFHSVKNSPTEGSVRRITPLKVNKNQMQEDLSFVQAMANSRIITPESSPKNEQIPNTSEHTAFSEKGEINSVLNSPEHEKMTNDTNTFESASFDQGKHGNVPADSSPKYEQMSFERKSSKLISSDEEEYDSPIKVIKKKGLRKFHSDSEESDTESNANNEDKYFIENKENFQEHSESLSNDEEESDSEKADNEVDVISVHSGEEHSSSENDEEINSNSESENADDLEQTFATCKDKTESSSEDEQSSSEYSDENYSDSDESGRSLFSEDD